MTQRNTYFQDEKVEKDKIDIKNLKINGCEPFLLIGIVRPEGDELSEAAQWFIENFKKLL